MVFFPAQTYSTHLFVDYNWTTTTTEKISPELRCCFHKWPINQNKKKHYVSDHNHDHDDVDHDLKPDENKKK